MSAPHQRRGRDPYAESFRERHAVGIGRIRRWIRRILLFVTLYVLYLVGMWLLLPWGQGGLPTYSIGAANSFIPTLLVRLFGLGFTLFFAMMFLIVQFVALFWFLARGRTYIIFPGEYDATFDDVRGQKAAV